MRANLKFLYLMETFSGLSRGSYLVCIGWIFFRADSLEASVTILRELASPWGQPFTDKVMLGYGAIGIGILLLVEALTCRHGGLDAVLPRVSISLRFAFSFALLFAIIFLGVGGAGQFIYFQF